MGDYNVQLSQLHLRVWEEELGLAGALSEHGHIEFGRQGPGILSVFLSASDPGCATIEYAFVDDYFEIGLTTESARDLCNTANEFSTGAMLVDWGATIKARLPLFYLPLDETGALPDEGFLQAWIGPAMSEIEKATKEFAYWLRKKAEE
jgi:hypothetical protein